MAYFNYHARAQNLIKTGKLKQAIIKKKHGAISPALVLVFDGHKPMPIRPEKWFFYFKLIEDFGITIENENN